MTVRNYMFGWSPVALFKLFMKTLSKAGRTEKKKEHGDLICLLTTEIKTRQVMYI